MQFVTSTVTIIRCVNLKCGCKHEKRMKKLTQHAGVWVCLHHKFIHVEFPVEPTRDASVHMPRDVDRAAEVVQLRTLRCTRDVRRCQHSRDPGSRMSVSRQRAEQFPSLRNIQEKTADKDEYETQPIHF